MGVSQLGVGRLHVRVWEKVTAVSCRGGGWGGAGVGSFSGDATFTGTRARETGRGQEDALDGRKDGPSTSPGSVSPCERSCTHLTAATMGVIDSPAWDWLLELKSGKSWDYSFSRQRASEATIYTDQCLTCSNPM